MGSVHTIVCCYKLLVFKATRLKLPLINNLNILSNFLTASFLSSTLLGLFTREPSLFGVDLGRFLGVVLSGWLMKALVRRKGVLGYVLPRVGASSLLDEGLFGCMSHSWGVLVNHVTLKWHRRSWMQVNRHTPLVQILVVTANHFYQGLWRKRPWSMIRYR